MLETQRKLCSRYLEIYSDCFEDLKYFFAIEDLGRNTHYLAR